MHEEKQITPRFSALAIPFQGAKYFLTNPSLWWRPLAWTVLSLFAMGILFFSLLLWLWPTGDVSSVHYLVGGSEAMGYSLLAVVLFWLFVLPIPTAMIYEWILRKVLSDMGEQSEGERFLKGLTSSLKMIKGTFWQRIFWTLFPLLFLFVLPPLFTFFSFVGMGYITLLDATDVSLALQGIEGRDRLRFIRSSRLSLLGGGVVTGILMLLFLFTLVGFVFLIPSLYIGTLLWVRIRSK